jgi:8-oxo-dGTP pyrophosphatase MutT (NUDIX family)
MEITVEKIRTIIQHREVKEEPPSNRIPSAVLIPLINEREELHILFIRKVEDNSLHSGQVSFPGGAKEDEDPHLLVTALREVHEEIGIPPQSWEVLGPLDPAKTLGSPFIIYPFVALLKEPSAPAPSPQEVARVFTVPLAYILERYPFQLQRFTWRGKDYETFLIPYGEEIIWGATARILKTFCRLIEETHPSGAGPRKEEPP